MAIRSDSSKKEKKEYGQIYCPKNLARSFTRFLYEGKDPPLPKNQKKENKKTTEVRAIWPLIFIQKPAPMEHPEGLFYSLLFPAHPINTSDSRQFLLIDVKDGL